MADDGKENRGCCQKVGDGFSNFAKFLFNKETGQVMGRSGESWLKIGVFYLIFYGFLAAFFTAMLTVFLKTLNEPGKGGPKLTQFLDNKPGLTYKSLGASLAKLAKGDAKLNKTELIIKYAEAIDPIFKSYGKGGCADSPTGMGDTECKFNKSLLGDCATDFGIDNDKPCVFVKINKVYGWVPQESGGVGNYLKLDCGDKDGVTVTPAGFHIGSFPFRGQSDFELPVVAVKIDVKKITKVICQLKGPGIEVSESSVPHRAFAKVEIS